jgi:uncharacterized membrane protein (DUF2068 family)
MNNCRDDELQEKSIHVSADQTRTVLIIDRRKLAQLCVNSALDGNFFGTRSTTWSSLALTCILKIVVQFVQSSGIWHTAAFGQFPGKRATEDLYIWEKQT